MAILVDDLEFSGSFVCVNREMATNVLNAAKYIHGMKKEVVRHGDADG